MRFIREYAITIMAVSVLSLLLRSLLPKSSQKYITVVIGLLVMLSLLAPLTKLPHFSETFALPQIRLDDAALSSAATKPYVAQRFERELALAISRDVHQAFGTSVSCRVHCTVNETGQITAISGVRLSPYGADIAAYIARVYGIEKDVITS